MPFGVELVMSNQTFLDRTVFNISGNGRDLFMRRIICDHLIRETTSKPLYI